MHIISYEDWFQRYCQKRRDSASHTGWAVNTLNWAIIAFPLVSVRFFIVNSTLSQNLVPKHSVIKNEKYKTYVVVKRFVDQRSANNFVGKIFRQKAIFITSLKVNFSNICVQLFPTISFISHNIVIENPNN